MDDIHLQFEGKPISTFEEKNKVEEVKREINDTINEMKKCVVPKPRSRYPLSRGQHGRPRFFSDEEIEKMNQRRKRRGEVARLARRRRERLFEYIRDCVERDEFFGVAEHIIAKVDHFTEFMSPLVKVKDDKKPYAGSSVMYHDIKTLVDSSKIYAKGKRGNRQFFLVPPEEKNRATASAVAEIVSPADVVQRIILEIVVKVRTE